MCLIDPVPLKKPRPFGRLERVVCARHGARKGPEPFDPHKVPVFALAHDAGPEWQRRCSNSRMRRFF